MNLETNEPSVKVFGADRQEVDSEYIKHMDEMAKEEEKQKEKSTKDDSDDMLLDKSEKFVVVKTWPYSKQFNVVDFIGFEDYEAMDGWTIDEEPVKHSKAIVRNEFSGTGKNYIRVESKKELKRMLANVTYKDFFIASAWIRMAEKVEINRAVDWFWIKMNGESMPGSVKQVTGDWMYVEADTKSIAPSQLIKEQNSVDVEVIINHQKAELHVDHVRISPLNFNFEANVYDVRSSQLTEHLHVNGKVTRYMNDKYSRRIAEFNEEGLIKYFATYSKFSGMRNACSSCSPQNTAAQFAFSARLQIRPAKGFVEYFSPYTIEQRWNVGGIISAQSSPAAFNFNGILATKETFSSKSLALRFVNNIEVGALEINICNRSIKIVNSQIIFKDFSSLIQRDSEVILLTTSKFDSLWIEGTIVYESRNNEVDLGEHPIWISSSGSHSTISDLLIMEDAELLVSYLNRASNPVQEIMLQDSGTIDIRQLIYDELDRRVATTQWTTVSIEQLGDGRILQYQQKFVENDDLKADDSFLKVGIMKGLVNENNEIFGGYPYMQEEYYDNPLTIRKRVGQPGVDYSLKEGTFHEYFFNSSVSFIQLHYPQREGFSKEQENKPNGLMQVTVYNQRNKKVAEFTRPQTFQDILTTYVYDENGEQVQMLPPNYYVGEFVEKNRLIVPQMKKVESKWATTTDYDLEKNITTSRYTPDGGRVDFLYDEFNLLRYQLHYAEGVGVDKIIYFKYNVFGRVCETGVLSGEHYTLNMLNSSLHADEDIIQSGKNVIFFDYGESEDGPALRGRTERIVKINDGVRFTEERIFDEDSKLLRKTFINLGTNQRVSLEYVRENDKIKEIYYPHSVDGVQLALTYDYNLKGEVVKIFRITWANDSISYLPIFGVDHNAEGSVTQISHLYGDRIFNQTYRYAAPGVLVQIKNDFLTETIFYNDKGYGFDFTGDGNILRTEFQATWHEKCNRNLIPLNAWAFVNDMIDLNQAELCFDALIQRGYIDQEGHPAKTFYSDLELKMPFKCLTSWMHFSERMLEKGFPLRYGHSYAYGGHGELLAAKAFIGDEADRILKPFGEKSFVQEVFAGHDNSTFYPRQLWASFWENYFEYRALGIKKLFSGETFNLNSIEQLIERVAFHNGLGVEGNSSLCGIWYQKESDRKSCTSDFNSYLKKTKLNDHIENLLKEPTGLKASFFRYLSNTLLMDLGKSPGDVESLSIDANGNHKLFYTGFKRFQLTYKAYSNQIDQLFEGSRKLPRQMIHDSEGNVIKALHKHIERLDYDPLTQRVSRIVMTDNRTIELGYDHQGERISKRVRNEKNQLVIELHYIRDNQGLPMAEFRKDYPKPDDPRIVIHTTTAYIHGPLGLVGFFRNNKYYNLLLDHEGSTRLVVHKGKVVAAYDYLPYGQLIRKFGTDTNAHIAYRYTGQEYDEETDLYNYHARIYDPDIGRFYQIDPAEQYPSAYKYAGNSPVSQVDPDGQFAFLIFFLVCAIVGAYLGAATANNSWNPAKWDWADKKTWIGLFVGGVVGGFAAFGGVGAFGYFAALTGSMVGGAICMGVIGAVGAYLGAAAASFDWNPANWDWTSPAVWNGLFTGVSIAVSFPTGAAGISKTFFSLASAITKTVYAMSLYVGFVLLLYVGGALANDGNFNLAEWDWKNPNTWFGMLETASAITMGGGIAFKKHSFLN
ncbi:uncharacterized protein LOC129755757 [Uranotaenia lowii]|uniref:uncharacterized protein LOC129755757 n=1 Tax=Uranotaenia lowii TaxID=190385 RepID=UPI002479A81C|nr:uncharacterized protein LOC129755757 [Uranotaenia lowii]